MRWIRCCGNPSRFRPSPDHWLARSPTAPQPPPILHPPCMNLQRAGKRALVTGSTAGIGYAIAEALSKKGARVIINGRTKGRVDHAVAKLQAAFGEVHGLAADLGAAEGVRQAIGQFPDIEILVNNLGIFEPKPFEQIPDEDWLRFFEVNVLSGVRLSRYYLPRMKQQNWGRIIFVSSESALQIPAEMIHYGKTKTAQLAVARGIAESFPCQWRHREFCACRAHRERGRQRLCREPGKTAWRIQ